jgi:uncharacterized protein (TIGR03000 family)
MAMGCGSCGVGYQGGYVGGYHGGCSTCGVSGGGSAGCVGGVCQMPYAAPERRHAMLNVTLPADAVLLVDDYRTTSTTGQRLLTTPPLESGKDFHYTLTASVVRDGKTETVTKKVTVRAGETTEVKLEVPTAVAAR